MKVLRVETLDGIKFFLENVDCVGEERMLLRRGCC